jgi:hypothetical protein
MCQFWDDESARAEIGSVGNQFPEPRVRRVLWFGDAARGFLVGFRAAGFFAGRVDAKSVPRLTHLASAESVP